VPLRNILLVLAYDGTDFHGWQRQPNVPTIQACAEEALERIVGSPVQLWASGRTDAGVHAANQVANFKTDSRIPCSNLVKALNDVLPPVVRVKEAREVSDKFHARYDAQSKTYRYRIHQGRVCSPFVWRFVWHLPFQLDRARMAKAARAIEGEHDFTSFAALDDSSAAESHPGAENQRNDVRVTSISENRSDSVRKIFSSRILWRPQTSMLIYEVRGSGFLHHMVRNIVGTLVEVGRKKLDPSDLTRILNGRDRDLAGPTAPARGLCLIRVEY
jgi:tRNA pseudouridine38-40 synthase